MPYDGIQFASDGTAFVMTRTGAGPYAYYVTVITPSGTATTTPLIGTRSGGIQFAPDGSVVQAMDLRNGFTRIVVLKRADPVTAV